MKPTTPHAVTEAVDMMMPGPSFPSQDMAEVWARSVGPNAVLPSESELVLLAYDGEQWQRRVIPAKTEVKVTATNPQASILKVNDVYIPLIWADIEYLDPNN